MENNIRKSPYEEKVEPGKYAWCSCGLTQKGPYCDGTHKGTDKRPVIEIVTEAKTVYWCGCKKSDSKPYCDGTHSKL